MNKTSITEISNISHSEQISQFATLEERKNFLNEKVEKLKFITDQLDPYKPLPEVMRLALKEFHLDHEKDPFALTNKLIILLEDALNELHELKQNTQVLK
jgi:hypothetical protein